MMGILTRGFFTQIAMAIFNEISAVRIASSDRLSSSSAMHPSKAGYVPFVDATSDSDDKKSAGNTYIPPKQ